MTVSPDLPGFQAVDVTQLDVTDPADLVDLALARASELLPDWQPREGNVEVVLLEEFAPLIALLAARVEAIVPAVTEQILGMSGLPRNQGTAASLGVEVSLSDEFGHIIPAGTAVAVGDPNADVPTFGEFVQDVTVPQGQSVGTGVITVSTVGVINDLSTATEVVLVDAVPYVDGIAVTSVITPGTDPEAIDAYLARGSAWLASLTQMLGRADQFAARTLTDLRVGRALGINRWDGTSATPGDVPGWVTVLALSAAGDALDATVLTQLQQTLGALASADLLLAVQSPVVTSVDVDVSVSVLPGNVASEVQAAVDAAIASYLSPLAWPWGEALRVSRLRQVIETTAGVDAVISLDPASDVVIDDNALLRAGTITVTAA